MSNEQTFNDRLIAVQSKLKAPKSQWNKYSSFYFRSVEDILEAVKPLNKEHGLLLTITDKPYPVGERVYVEATATLSDGKDSVSVTGYAREPLNKKGFDESQLTGTASSYARKYALNGLYLIDDNKDPDTNENENQHMNGQQQPQQQLNNPPQQQNNYQQPGNVPSRANEKQMGLLHSRAAEVAQMYGMPLEQLKAKMGIRDVHTEAEFTQILQRLNDGADNFKRNNGQNNDWNNQNGN